MGITRDLVRVVHVDDDPDVADVAATYLQRKHDGFEVAVVLDRGGRPWPAGGRLLRLRRLGRRDAAADRVEFLRDVRERYPDIPFILFTGKGTEEIASDAISAGVTDYLQTETGTSQ